AIRRPLRFDQVAEAAQSPDRRAATSQLLTQARDEGLERVRAEVVVESRELFSQCFLAHDASRRRHQLDQHVVLARGKLELESFALRIDEETAGIALEAQTTDFGNSVRRVDPAPQRPQAGGELSELERLAEVVVR